MLKNDRTENLTLRKGYMGWRLLSVNHKLEADVSKVHS